mgnify:CR=1 FL=1
MRLPKYVREKSGTYHYQRDYPTNLRHLFDRKTFTYPLKLSANNATEMQLNKKAIEAEEAFERQKLLISNSDPDALNATELDKIKLLEKSMYLIAALKSALNYYPTKPWSKAGLRVLCRRGFPPQTAKNRQARKA